MFTIAQTETAASIYRRAKDRAAEIAALQEAQKNDLAVLASIPPEVGKVLVEGLGSFTVSENNTYEESAMREALSPGQVKRVSVAKIDKAVVKRLYPDVYAAAKHNVGRKVTLG